MLRIDNPAPPFTLMSTKGEISLESCKGKYVVLFFYPLDFTPVWSTEVPEFNRRLKDFEKFNTVVLGVCTDSVPSHEAWAQSLGGVDYPLLSDYNKEVSRNYGVLMEKEGIALRGTFIICPQGILKHISINDTATGRNVNEFIRLLAAMQTKKACPVNWQLGDATIG